ncbi:MAG: hypothetical protein JSW73_00730, partial [Candidatus Woesearchaeota archaeon]
IKKEVSNPNNRYGKKIISVFQVGSTVDTVGKKPIYEDNESSDIDLIFVGDTNYLMRNRPELENYVGSLRSGKIQVWLKSEAAYKEPEKYFQPGHPAADLRVLDGWDGLASKLGFLIEVTSGKTIYGKNIIEDLKSKSLKYPNFTYVPAEEGYELVIVAIRDLLKGLYGRNINTGIESLINQGLRETDAKNAFKSFLKKKYLPKDKQDLTEEEKAAKNYILTKDNDMAKATLRAFLGAYVQSSNDFPFLNPHTIYHDIDEMSKLLLASEGKKPWRDIIDRAYRVKINKELKDSKVYDSLWPWDWTGRNIKGNKQLVDSITGFFKECLIYTSEQSYLAGYTWTQHSQEKISYHLSRRAPGIIDVLSKTDETLDSAADLYIGEIVGIFGNKLEPPSLDDKLKWISEHKEPMLDIVERLVQKYDIPGEIKIQHKNRLLQVGQMQLMLAQQGKKEYYSEAKKTLEQVFMQPEENVFSLLLPPRTSWNLENEALAYLNLGECLLGLNRNDEAIKSIEKSIEINPRNAYSWKLLGELHSSNPEKSRLYNLISHSLKNPKELFSLRLELDKQNMNFVKKKLYSPWMNLINTNINRDIESVSSTIVDLMTKQRYFFNEITKKEKHLISIAEHVSFIEEEKSRLKELISYLNLAKNELKNIGGENYSQLEKTITKQKRNTLLAHERTMEEKSLARVMVNLIEERDKIEPKIRNEPSSELINEYVDILSKISFIGAREELKKLKKEKIINKKQYTDLYKKTTISLPEELIDLKKELYNLQLA